MKNYKFGKLGWPNTGKHQNNENYSVNLLIINFEY